jgi:hypothetical protein
LAIIRQKEANGLVERDDPDFDQDVDGISTDAVMTFGHHLPTETGDEVQKRFCIGVLNLRSQRMTRKSASMAWG